METEKPIDFSEMKAESDKVIEDIAAPEFTAGETPSEKVQLSPKEELEELKIEAEKRKLIKKMREELGDPEGIGDPVIERIIELSKRIGENYQNLRPELRIEIAKLPEIGTPLKRDKAGELEEQEINPENLAFVRTTDNSPIEENGEKIILTPYEATKETEEPIFRLTTHWTANHLVESHAAGNFENRGMIVIVPGTDMIEINGRPQCLSSIDTFWNKNISLPESSVLLVRGKAGGDQSGIHLLDSEDASEIINTCLEAMGYTAVRGNATYSETPFDVGVINLAERIGVEETDLHIEVRTRETAIENFFYFEIGGEFPGGALERMVRDYWKEIPEQVKSAVFKKIEELLSKDLTPKKKHGLYGTIGTVLELGEQFPEEARKNFLRSLSAETMIDFIKSEAEYWKTQEGIRPEELIGHYLDKLTGILDKEAITKLRKELS